MILKIDFSQIDCYVARWLDTTRPGECYISLSATWVGQCGAESGAPAANNGTIANYSNFCYVCCALDLTVFQGFGFSFVYYLYYSDL